MNKAMNVKDRITGWSILFFMMLCPDSYGQRSLSNSSYPEQIQALEQSGIQPEAFQQPDFESLLNAPVLLNVADELQLIESGLFSAVQARHLIQYRSVMGSLLSIYELQAVPGLEAEQIRQIRRFVSLSEHVKPVSAIRKRIVEGQHQLLFRYARQLSGVDTAVFHRYAGNADRLLMRYRYQYRQQMEYGWLIEKDPGERLWSSRKSCGVDFLSGHLFIRQLGIIRALAVGDFTVNMGQGLVIWQSLAVGKNSDAGAMTRYSELLRPYHAAGEFNFLRGAGITIGKGRWEATAFASSRKLDANYQTDSLEGNKKGWVTSILESGFHRTTAELNDAGTLRMLTLGMAGRYRFNRGHWGIQWLHRRMSVPLLPETRIDNLFGFKGSKLSNASVDFRYSYRNMYWYGELATSFNSGYAVSGGTILTTGTQSALHIHYRSGSVRYWSMQTASIGSSSAPANEQGLFLGFNIQVSQKWRLAVWVDFYRYPWLRYQISLPSFGYERMLQLYYKPNRHTELYFRYRTLTSMESTSGDGYLVRAEKIARHQFRLHLNFPAGHGWTLRNRIEWNQSRGKTGSHPEGFLIFLDAIYQPLQLPVSASCRLQYFETNGYDSRIYAYENDLPFAYSVPAFYGNGIRYYLNFNYDLRKNLKIGLRWAGTLSKQDGVSQNSPEGDGMPSETEFKCQIQWQF